MAKNKAIKKMSDGLYQDSDGNRLTKAEIILTEENIIKEGEEYTDFAMNIIKAGYNGNIEITEHLEFPRLQANKILDSIPHFFFVPGLSKAKKLLILETIFQEQLENKPVRTVYELMPGYNFLNDNTLLVSANKIYGKFPDDIHIRLPCQTFTVREPIEGTKGELSWILNLIKCGEAQTALFVSSLSSYTEPFLKILKIDEKLCVVLLGKTGCGKTSFGSLILNRFTNFKGCSLTSDKKDFFETLSKCGSSPVLIEELNKTNSNSLKEKNNRMFSELVQCFSSSGSKELGGNKLTFSITPVITAEYVIKNYSTINRCLIIGFPDKPDFSKLSWLQQNISRYDLFMDKFLHWICNSYNRYKDKVQNWSFEPFKVECEDSYAGISRVKRTYQILKITEKILLSFIREEYSLPEEQLRKIRKDIDCAIDESIYNTISYLKQIDGETGTYYVDELLNLFFHNYNDYVAEDYEEYKKSRRKNSPQRKIFFRHNNYFCITGDDLYNYYAEECEPKFKITKQAISNQLLSHGLLKIRQGERSFPINTYDDSQNKHRYYHIFQCELLNLLNEKHYKYWSGRITLDTLQDS